MREAVSVKKVDNDLQVSSVRQLRNPVIRFVKAQLTSGMQSYGRSGDE